MELSLKSYRGCLVRRPRPPAHETTLAGTPVSRTSLSAHETTSAGTPVSIWSYPCARGRLAGQLFSGRALTLGGKMVTEPRSCSSCSTELKASARDHEASLRCSIISSRFVQRADPLSPTSVSSRGQTARFLPTTSLTSTA